MTITAVALIAFGLLLAIIPVSGVYFALLENFAGLFRLSLLTLGLFISLAGIIVLIIDLVLTYYRFHPHNFRRLIARLAEKTHKNSGDAQ
ncbi:MAG: hypothetical protein JW874_11985 [Spirochaetales bacterium]|nr:hypothetical protein [Spirochaetales bacterium]